MVSIGVIMKPKADLYKHTDSEERYKRLFETAQDGIFILDASTGKILDANPFISELSGYSKEELLDKYIWDLGFIKSIEENKDKFIELQKKGYVRYENLPIKTKEGEMHYVEFISNSYVVGSTKVIQCNIRDITSRVSLEKTNRDLGRMYQVVLRCNQVLLHEMSVSALIGQMCKVLVSSGGFLAAWVGYAPVKPDNIITPIATEGIDNDYFRMMGLDAGKNEHNGLVSKAIYAHQLLVCQDLQQDERDELERDFAVKHGFHSVAVIPMRSQKLTPYILVVYGHATQDLNDNFS